MNRFYSRDTMTLDPEGQYVLYTDAQKYVDDSNVKSANLQLLVDKVLAYTPPQQGTDGYPAQDYFDMVELARSLKQ